MHISSLAIITLIVTFITLPNVYSQEPVYDYVHYKTIGGPSIDFKVFTSESQQRLTIDLKHYYNEPKNMKIVVKRDQSNGHIFDTYFKVLYGQVELKKIEKLLQNSPVVATGSFTYIDAVSESGKEKISNSKIVSVFHDLREIIVKEIKK